LEKYETTDIFRGAFFLCNGGVLSGIRMKENGRRSALFQFTGEDLNRLEVEYRSGRALVNPVQFRESLNDLRDRLFEILRGSGDKPLMREERMRYDREREDRGNKARH
jgi:hypothetical protein